MITDFNNLEHFRDDIYYNKHTLDVFKIDKNGELQPTGETMATIKYGSTIRTIDQQRASRQYFEKINQQQTERFLKFANIAAEAEEERKRLEEEMKEQKSKKPPVELRQSRKPFFWVYADAFSNIAPANATRLVMLASYMNYDGRLMRTRTTPMITSDLQDILKLTKSKVYKFLDECKDYIYTTDDGIYFKDNCNIFRGQLPQLDKFTHFQKIFCKSVQKLFKETDKSQLKPLGYVFQILPYINLEYNVLAISDPYENDFDRVQPLSTKQFCQLIGYNPNQSSRLKKELKALQFEYKGRKEYLLMYINTTDDINDEKIVINPHILYNGQQYENVKKFGSFCKVREKKPRHFGDKPKLAQSEAITPKN